MKPFSAIFTSIISVNFLFLGSIQANADIRVGSAFMEWLDAWELEGEQRLPGADPDKDGRINLEEFAFNGNPVSGINDDKFRYVITSSDGQDGKTLTLTIPVRNGAIFEGPGALTSRPVDGVIYHIQGTVDLQNFTKEEVVETETSGGGDLPSLDEGWSYRTFALSSTAPHIGAGYLRAVAQEVPSYYLLTNGSNLTASDRQELLKNLGLTDTGRSFLSVPQTDTASYPRINADGSITLMDIQSLKGEFALSKADLNLESYPTDPTDLPLSMATATELSKYLLTNGSNLSISDRVALLDALGATEFGKIILTAPDSQTLAEAAGLGTARADISGLQMAMGSKADAAATATALEGKADAAATTAALSTKADAAATKADLDTKATSADLSPAFGAQLANVRRTAGGQATVFFIGDSMGAKIPDYLYQKLEDQFPIAGYALDALFHKTVSGTVVAPGDNNNTGTFLPAIVDSGKVWNMSASSQMEIGRVFAGNQLKLLKFNRAILWCSKRPGGGTLKIEYMRNNVDWLPLGTIDTNGAVGELARGEWTLPSTFHAKLRITATGGPVYFIGAKLFKDGMSGNGLILARSSIGGLAFFQSNRASAEIRNAIGADLGTGIIFPFYAEKASETPQSVLNTWINNWRTAMPTSDQIHIEQTGGPENMEDLNHMRGLYHVAKLNYPFVSTVQTYEWLKSYDYTEAMDWNKSSTTGNPDAVHMVDETWRAMAGMIYNRAFGGYEPTVGISLVQRTGNSSTFRVGQEVPVGHHANYEFATDRAGNSSMMLKGVGINGNDTSFGLQWFGTGQANAPQFGQLVIQTDDGFKTPFTFDRTGRVVAGPYSATPQSATALGGGFVVREEAASRPALIAQHLSSNAVNTFTVLNSEGNLTAAIKPDGTVQSSKVLTGAITATGQVEATGQTLATNYSLMTRALADARYAMVTNSVTAPNNTVPVHAWFPTSSATDVDMVVGPKGNGALLAQSPDNTVKGGNKRGAGAVDFQTTRINAGHVASGLNAVISGGSNNIAMGNNSVVGGGTNNLAIGVNSVVPGGDSNRADGSYSFATGYNADTKGSYGAVAESSGQFTARGDAQRVRYTLRRETSDAISTELSMSGNEPVAATRIGLGANISLAFQGQAVARSADGTSRAWHFSGLIKRGASADSVQMVGPVTITGESDSAAASWKFTVDADTTNGSLRFQGTGDAATNIRWLVSVETVELGF